MSIYLDYAATTPLDPRVAEKMSRYLTLDGDFANPGSTHVFGRAAKQAVDVARSQVADLLDADPAEIIWTSGATEANNLALKGAATLYQGKGRHIITMTTEHPSILETCQFLEKQGFNVTYLKSELNGLLDIAKLRAATRHDTILISIMHVNNEIGVIQDIEKISQISAEKNILLHVDAAQSAGKIPLSVKKINADLISLSAHKLYGPKGMGALYVRRKPRVRVAAQIHGGGQEQGMRSGTLATHQIVGMGEAFAIANKQMQDDFAKISTLQKIFLQELQGIRIRINGVDAERYPEINAIDAERYPEINVIDAARYSEINTIDAERYPEINVIDAQYYPGILNLQITSSAEKLIQQLPDLAFSVGSTCHSKGQQSSHVLRALGLSQEQARQCIRISFGRFTSVADVKNAAQCLRDAVSSIQHAC